MYRIWPGRMPSWATFSEIAVQHINSSVAKRFRIDRPKLVSPSKSRTISERLRRPRSLALHTRRAAKFSAMLIPLYCATLSAKPTLVFTASGKRRRSFSDDPHPAKRLFSRQRPCHDYPSFRINMSRTIGEDTDGNRRPRRQGTTRESLPLASSLPHARYASIGCRKSRRAAPSMMPQAVAEPLAAQRPTHYQGTKSPQ